MTSLQRSPDTALETADLVVRYAAAYHKVRDFAANTSAEPNDVREGILRVRAQMDEIHAAVKSNLDIMSVTAMEGLFMSSKSQPSKRKRAARRRTRIFGPDNEALGLEVLNATSVRQPPLGKDLRIAGGLQFLKDQINSDSFSNDALILRAYCCHGDSQSDIAQMLGRTQGRIAQRFIGEFSPLLLQLSVYFHLLGEVQAVSSDTWGENNRGIAGSTTYGDWEIDVSQKVHISIKANSAPESSPARIVVQPISARCAYPVYSEDREGWFSDYSDRDGEFALYTDSTILPHDYEDNMQRFLWTGEQAEDEGSTMLEYILWEHGKTSLHPAFDAEDLTDGLLPFPLLASFEDPMPSLGQFMLGRSMPA